MHFEGISGAISVSIVAFSIVFGVLFLLTLTIFAMRLFAGSGDKPAGGAPAEKGAAAPVKAAPAAASVQASGSPQAKIIAAITAAILAMTGGRGRILSIQPAPAAGSCGRPFSTWRASGVVALVNNRLNRPWNR